MATYWNGSAPVKCDICSFDFGQFFVDGKTKMGPWACMCKICFSRYGLGLGTGRGQQYEKQPSGEWLKTQG